MKDLYQSIVGAPVKEEKPAKKLIKLNQLRKNLKAEPAKEEPKVEEAKTEEPGKAEEPKSRSSSLGSNS